MSIAILAVLMLAGVPVSAVWMISGVVLLVRDPVGALGVIVAGGLGAVLSAVIGGGLLNGRARSRLYFLWTYPVLAAVDVVVTDIPRPWRFAIPVLLVYLLLVYVFLRPGARRFFEGPDRRRTEAV